MVTLLRSMRSFRVGPVAAPRENVAAPGGHQQRPMRGRSYTTPARGPLMPAAGTLTLFFPTSTLTPKVATLAKRAPPRFRALFTRSGTLDTSPEAGTGSFSRSVASFPIRVLTAFRQLEINFPTSAAQSVHSFSTALLYFSVSASDINRSPLLLNRRPL